jgi:two-component system sensor histidine kinase BarA
LKFLDNSSSGLNKKILIVTLLPLVLLSIILTVYFIVSQTSDTQKMLILQGHTIAKLVAAESKDSILQENITQIAKMSKTPLSLDGVADIVFLDNRYKTIMRSANFPLNLQPTSPSFYHDGLYWYFVQAVKKGIPLSSLYANSTDKLQSTETIGWVIVVLSEEPAKLRNQNIVLSVIAVIAGILLFSFWFSSRLAKQITIPISEITSVVEAFQKGNFDARARESHSGKLHALASGINRMALRIKVSTTDMETRVNSATRRLQAAMHHLEQQNEALESTREKEIEANQAKDQFLARMSHELRTPLTSVLGFSKILQESNITEDQVEPIRIINHTSQLLLSIVDDILDYSKLQKNAITLERIDYNLETAMLDILEMQAPMAHSKGLELSLVSTNSRSYEIKGDPTRFKQIFSNLVSNAIKFTDIGSVAISLNLQHISSHQSLIIISVTDTGIGISDEQLNKLFQAFVQADTSITRRFGGSGLGLVIAKTLTTLMGGKLEIYSKQGRGTNVTLQIPALSNSEHTPVVEKPLKATKPVLIYDENQHTRRSIALMLERKKYKYRSLSELGELLELIPKYEHLIIGIKSTDLKNTLIHQLLPLLSNAHKTVTFALPNGHPLPVLPKPITVINKPIRPETLMPSEESDYKTIVNIDSSVKFDNEICAVVAEDNVFNQILIGKILAKHNIKSFIASNGKEALELIAKHQPDLAIIDIHMPVMDGFEATKFIRQSSDMPIISLTANIIEQDHQKIIAAGSNCIVLKPINDVELIHKIRQLTKAPLKRKPQLLAEPVIAIDNPMLKKITNLADYNLDQALLRQELERLISLLETNFKHYDILQMRSNAHQLVGLAGLYELPEVELTTIELQDTLKVGDTRSTWRCLSRLIRIIKNSELDNKLTELND